MKKRYDGFHESYFTHSCPIISEKDVLLTDIHGMGYYTACVRWYHNLFLLSTNNEHSRGFYNSSHAMRIERFRQFRKYRSRIHPMSKFSNFWETLTLLSFVINKILFRFTSTVIFDSISVAFYYLGAIIEIIMFLDIFVHLKTGYIDTQMKTVVLGSKKCLIHYCSTKLFLHVASLLPMHCLMFIKYGSNVNCGLCKTSMFICSMKILSIFSLYRVFELSSCWTKKRFSHVTMHMLKFLRIIILGLVTMLQFYDLVDVVWIVNLLTTKELNTSSFIGMLILIRYGIYTSVPNYMVLCFDVSRIFKSLMRFSFGIKHSTYLLDRLASVVAYVISNVFYVWGLLECYSLVYSIYYPEDKILSARKFVQNLIIANQVAKADEMKAKTDQYFAFNPTRYKVLEFENGLYKSVPQFLKDEAILSYHSKLLLRIPMFHDWPLSQIEVLALLLEPEVYLHNAVVAEAFAQGKGLMIVDMGILAVYTSRRVETGHLIDGDYFGEVSLFTDNEARTSCVVAVSPCRILILDKFAFRKYMRSYPQMFYELRTKLRSLLKPGAKETVAQKKPSIVKFNK